MDVLEQRQLPAALEQRLDLVKRHAWSETWQPVSLVQDKLRVDI
jgi:hypothetical protein